MSGPMPGGVGGDSLGVWMRGEVAVHHLVATPHSVASAWTIAAAGSASRAPTNPNSEAPPSAAPNATAGWSSIVRAVMRGMKK